MVIALPCGAEIGEPRRVGVRAVIYKRMIKAGYNKISRVV